MSNQQQTKSNQVTTWEQREGYLHSRGINEAMWNTLCNTIYPSSKKESVMLAFDYCESRDLDIMMKPIHLVPMQVKNAQTGNKEWRDVPMPGVGLYRIQASRSGDYAGADEPEFGPVIEVTFPDAYNASKMITVRYPEYCKYTVHKLIGDRVVSFSAKEYWLENYATMKAGSDCPNAMWKKRPHGQLAKCAEAQALRKAWPEIGQEPTAEEMEGKEFFVGEKDVTPTTGALNNDQMFNEIYDRGFKAIEAGKQTPDQIISFIKAKNLTITPEKEAALRNIKVAA
jgi:phage recombination protein Bet